MPKKSNNTPKFITFEGCEGSGKSTQSKMLHEYLLSQGIDSILTREIGGTKTAEKIREYLLHNELLGTTELLMVMAARFEHVENVIKPALKQGTWVICDRFIDSTISYQGVDLSTEYILALHKSVFGDFMPDRTFFIDLDPEISLNRALARGDKNKFEEMDLSFHQKVYANFKRLTTLFPQRIITINGSASKDQIHGEIVHTINV